MEEVFGDVKLCQGQNQVQPGACMNGKSLMAIYFGAHWVPPCRVFIEHLTNCYKAADGKL